MNYRFDLEAWQHRFPLDVSQNRYKGSPITSPVHLCHNEWLRLGMKDQFSWGDPLPADVFVLAEGEPDDRTTTKIGGLPYRSSSESWPKSKSGYPMIFLAQFNFSGSRDVVGELESDLLLIFVEDEEKEHKEYHFEWVTDTIPSSSMVDRLPALRGDAISPVHGFRCRVSNYPRAVRINNEELYPKCDGKDVRKDYWILQYQATQIGRGSFSPQEQEGGGGWSRLCMISSVQPEAHGAYPWVNVEQPLCAPGDWPSPNEYLMIGDLGCISIFMDSTGSLAAVEESF